MPSRCAAIVAAIALATPASVGAQKFSVYKNA